MSNNEVKRAVQKFVLTKRRERLRWIYKKKSVSALVIYIDDSCGLQYEFSKAVFDPAVTKAWAFSNGFSQSPQFLYLFCLFAAAFFVTKTYFVLNLCNTIWFCFMMLSISWSFQINGFWMQLQQTTVEILGLNVNDFYFQQVLLRQGLFGNGRCIKPSSKSNRFSINKLFNRSGSTFKMKKHLCMMLAV